MFYGVFRRQLTLRATVPNEIPNETDYNCLLKRFYFSDWDPIQCSRRLDRRQGTPASRNRTYLYGPAGGSCFQDGSSGIGFVNCFKEQYRAGAHFEWACVP